jgi:hypothetical protein
MFLAFPRQLMVVVVVVVVVVVAAAEQYAYRVAPVEFCRSLLEERCNRFFRRTPPPP